MSQELFEFDEDRKLNRLAAGIQSLATRNVFLGTSSWKYTGWLGRIYSNSRYMSRGKFSRRKFEQTCIEEYAETFRTVGGDFSFYQFPSADYWTNLFAQVPDGFTFGLKVPEDITVERFPNLNRYGKRASRQNDEFLNDSLLDGLFLQRLAEVGASACARSISAASTASRSNSSRRPA